MGKTVISKMVDLEIQWARIDEIETVQGQAATETKQATSRGLQDA